MSTCLRGYGSYKRELVDELVKTFHRNPFSYKDAKQLPIFEHRAFMCLYHDGRLTLAKKGSQGVWHVSEHDARVAA